MTTAIELGLGPKPTAARRKDPFAVHVRARLDTQLRALLARETGTKSGKDPEDLHQMRVTVRRLRAAVKAGGLDGAEPLQTELKWLGAALGPVRDLDVQLDRLRTEAAGFDDDERAAVEELLTGLVEERKAARRRMLSALRSKRYRALLVSLAAAVRSKPVDTRAPSAQQPPVLLPYRKLRKAVAALGEDPPDADLHSLRIKGKRLRYAAELVGSRQDDPMALLVKATKAFQEVLGEHQDATVAEETIRRLAAGRDEPRIMFVAGRLVEREHARKLAFRELWRDRWAAVDLHALAALNR